MNSCQRCRDQLGEYLDGTLSPSLRGEVSAHLESCADCRRELRELELTMSALHSMVAVPAPPEIRLRVRAQLQDEREAQKSDGFLAGFNFWRPRQMIWSGTLTFSALALLLVARTYGPTYPGSTAPAPMTEEEAARQAPVVEKTTKPTSAIQNGKTKATSSKGGANRSSNGTNEEVAPVPTTPERPNSAPIDAVRRRERVSKFDPAPALGQPSSKAAQSAPAASAPRNPARPAHPASSGAPKATSVAPKIARKVAPEQGDTTNDRVMKAMNSMPAANAATGPAPGSRFAFAIEEVAPTVQSAGTGAAEQNLAVDSEGGGVAGSSTSTGAEGATTMSGKTVPEGPTKPPGIRWRGLGTPDAVTSNGAPAPQPPKKPPFSARSITPEIPAAPPEPAVTVVKAEPRTFQVAVVPTREVKAAQVRVELPVSLRFAADDASASRVVWKGDMATGQPVQISFSLLGSSGGEKISVILEQKEGEAESKPIETQMLTLPIPKK